MSEGLPFDERAAARRTSFVHDTSISNSVSFALEKNSTSPTPGGTFPARPLSQSSAIPRLMRGELMGHCSIARSSCDASLK